jgi:hypothetical protein
MKYKDLIERLLPFAEEEISLGVSSEERHYGPERGDGKYIVDEVRFYHPDDGDGDMIVGVKIKYDKESCGTIGKSEIINPL